MKLSKQPVMPAYVDGCLSVYDIVDVRDEDSPDFPIRKIRKRKLSPIGFRELAIFDRTRVMFEQASIEVQRKVAIPQWDGISAQCVAVIDGKQFKVYSAVGVISKQGFPETELTLITPEMTYEVAE
jgi:hypothetical protein